MMKSDQKGKEFDLGLRSCTSYDAPCSVCEMMARCGHEPFKTTSVGCYRRFLPLGHPYRVDPSFGPNELRQPPPLRSMDGEPGGVGSRIAVEIAHDENFSLPYHQVDTRHAGRWT